MKSTIVGAVSFAGVIAILLAVAVYKELAVYISVVAIGLALALQRYVASFFGYLVISYGKVFSCGDRIRINTIKGDLRIKGDVKHIGLLHTVLEEVGDDEKLGGELTGRLIHIPNHLVLEQPILNFSKPYQRRSGVAREDYIFDEVRIPLTTDSDVDLARTLLDEVLRREDSTHLTDAASLFGTTYPVFLREAQNNPRVHVYLEAKQVWLKGKFVTPIHARNDLRTDILLKFLTEMQKLNGRVKLA